MTDEQIDRMIAAREKLTNVRDEQIDLVTVDAIDATLRDVPAGRRNDVDLLLGRRCATLPVDEAIKVAAAQARVMAEWLTPQQVAQLDNAEMVRIAADAMRNQEPIEY